MSATENPITPTEAVRRYFTTSNGGISIEFKNGSCVVLTRREVAKLRTAMRKDSRGTWTEVSP